MMPSNLSPSQSGTPVVRRSVVILGALLCMVAVLLASAEVRPEHSHVPRERGKSSPSLLHAFARVTKARQGSVVELRVDGNPAALGTVVGTNGLALTKASEISSGRLTCKLPDGQFVPARILAFDEDSDLALVKVEAKDLVPVQWAGQEVTVGQWVLTPGLETDPEAVGIVSVHPRKILPKQAYMGVILDHLTAGATIREIMPGLGADKAGLRVGDVIVSVNDQPVRSSDELVHTVRTYREGQTLKLRYRREDAEHTAEVQLSTPKADRRWRAFERQDRMNHLGGELSRRAEGFPLAIQHDTVLQPWQCGGPLLDLDGQAVGLNIARAGRVASYALPAATVEKLLRKLEQEQKPSVPVVLEHGTNSVQ